MAYIKVMQEGKERMLWDIGLGTLWMVVVMN